MAAPLRSHCRSGSSLMCGAIPYRNLAPQPDNSHAPAVGGSIPKTRMEGNTVSKPIPYFNRRAVEDAIQTPVYLVATGQGHEGRETYTRHEGAPPPLCDSERLFTTPPAAQPVAVPAGWALVPVDPSPDMLRAGCWSGSGDVSVSEEWARREVWGRMLAASPATPPAASAKPLTQQEIIKLWGAKSDGPSNAELVSFARSIERAHGIGGQQ